MVFFGGEPLGVSVLEELRAANIQPDLIVCSPDKPSGRGQKLTPPPVKEWAEAHQINVFQPTSYKDKAALTPLTEQAWGVFVVVAYNFILPKWLLQIPKHGVLNVHPSLLPKLRGPSPIRTAILENKRDEIGISIMLMDEKMDHGPILDQAPFEIASENWPVPGPELDSALAKMGGELLADALPAWLAGELLPQEQMHEAATYTGKFAKEDFLLDLNPHALPAGDTAFLVLCRINALLGIGDAYFLYNGERVKIKKAELAPSGELRLLRVVPAGKQEMDFTRFLQSIS